MVVKIVSAERCFLDNGGREEQTRWMQPVQWVLIFLDPLRTPQSHRFRGGTQRTTQSSSRHHAGEQWDGTGNHYSGDHAECDEQEQEPCSS